MTEFPSPRPALLSSSQSNSNDMVGLVRPRLDSGFEASPRPGLAMYKTIAFDAAQYFINLFCRFLFCHVTFDFTDVCALDSSFQREVMLGLDLI